MLGQGGTAPRGAMMADLTAYLSAIAYAHEAATRYEVDHNDKEAATRLRRAARLLMLGFAAQEVAIKELRDLCNDGPKSG